MLLGSFPNGLFDAGGHLIRRPTSSKGLNLERVKFAFDEGADPEM
jgi:hypothetical protein